MPDIAFWNKCNNKCVMCTNTEAFSGQDTVHYGLRRQIEKLERYLKGYGPVYLKNADKADFVSLTGGEPALHPEFFKLLAYFRKRLASADVTLLSNGRRFADKAFAGRFLRIARPPFTIGVPIHASGAALHDKIAGVRGAFLQTVKGLENLLSGMDGQRLELRIILHRLSIGGFPDLLAFLLKRFPEQRSYRVTAIHYEIEGMSLRNHRSLALKLSDSAAVVNSAAPLLARFRELRLYHFPLCLLKEELRPRAWITLPHEDRIYTAKCARCRARKKCLGLMLEYYKKFGDRELKPL